MTDPDNAPTTKLNQADPDVLLKTLRDGVFTGAVGIASGFAIFIMTWEQDLSVLKFVMILLMVALFTSGFEYIRDVIDGNEHHFRTPQLITRLFLVATFELFVVALHAVLTSDWGSLFQEIGTAVLGVTLANEVGAIWNMITMALLWVSLGAALGGGLAWAIGSMSAGRRFAENERAINEGRGPLVGILMGAVAAPLLVFAYVVGARLAVEFGWMVSKPGEWVATLQDLNDRIPGNYLTWGLKLSIWFMSKIGLMFPHSALGPIVATLAILVLVMVTISVLKEERNPFTYSLLAAPVVVLGAPLVGRSIYDDIKNVGILLLLVAIVWGMPGLLLGTALPFLRRPSENPKTWALVAWMATAFLIAFTVLIQAKWMLLFAAVLFGIGVFFWRGASIEDYWPLIAMCVAIVVLGVTQIAQRANFFNIQELSRALISQPLAVPDKPFNPFGAYITPKLRDLPPLPIYPECAKYRDVWDRLKCIEKEPTLTQKLHNIHRWLSAVSAEGDSSLKLATIARQIAAVLRDQAARDETLATAPEGRARTFMKEIAAAQSVTRSLLIDSRDQPKSISSQLERLTELSQRQPYAGLGFLVGQGLPASLYEEVTLARSNLAATIQSLTDRKTEMNEAIHTLEAANGHLESRLAKLKERLAQQFELCLNGSLGFWITLGLLAGWSRHNREVSSLPST